MKSKLILTCALSLLFSISFPKVQVKVQTEEEEKVQELTQQLESSALIIENDSVDYTIVTECPDDLDSFTGSNVKIGEVMSNYVLVPSKSADPVYKSADSLDYLGTFVATGYCACSRCCGSYANGVTASGRTATANHTIAVDTSVIPMGTQVVINGIVYTAEDTGGAIKGKRIDIFFASHSSALQWGRRKVDVYLYK